jgi:glycosyltransferase involved in cell wall biosynthesis
VIPNAIDLDDYKEKKNCELFEGLERPIYLSTSAFVKYKRPYEMVNAFRLTAEGTLVLTSDGPMREKVMQYCGFAAPNRCKYLGMLPHEMIVPLYQNADVFVQSARSEAFGVVYLEAMAAGLPIVTQKDERREYIVGKAGLLVDCSSVDEFHRALIEAPNRVFPTSEQLQGFTWREVTKKWVSLIDEII